MSYYYRILKDHPIGFWPLDESSGSIAHDYSGCLNNGVYYNFSSFDNNFPLVSGGSHGTMIDDTKYITFSLGKDYTGQTGKGSFGDKYSSDNDFSLEAWVYIKSQNSTNMPIFYNEDSTTGIYFKNSAIYFYVNNEYIAYSPDSISESIHIVATYDQNGIKLFINGQVVAKKQLTDFVFTNSSLPTLSIGPCLTDEYFIVDAPAIYRYSLSEDQVLNHFNAFQPIRPIQIVGPDGGSIFSGTDLQSPRAFKFSYPLTRSFKDLSSTNIFYDSSSNYVTLVEGETSGSISDYFFIPSGIDFVSSKIEWNADNGVVVSVSPSGAAGTYEVCKNGSALPQWQIGNNSFSDSGIVYVNIEINSVDSTIIKPKLKELNISFFTEKKLYADNGPEYITVEQPTSGSIDLDVWDFSAATEAYPVLRRNTSSGIRPESDAGFALNLISDINTIELILSTPETITDGSIFSSSTAHFSWGNTGLINKSGISSIYINGQNVSSATNISNLLSGEEIYHIVFILSSPVSNKIYFNSWVDSGVWKNSSTGYGYSNIGIYSSALSEATILNHYNLYTEKPYSYSESVSMNLTETGVFAYDNDWEVIKSV